MSVRSRSVLAWARRTFGSVADDPQERAARLLEEAAELAQSLELSQTEAITIVRRAYLRPPGDRAQEAAQTQLMLEALAESENIDLEEEASREMFRLLSVPLDEWRRRYNDKVMMGTARRSDVL